MQKKILHELIDFERVYNVLCEVLSFHTSSQKIVELSLLMAYVCSFIEIADNQESKIFQEVYLPSREKE